MNWLEPFIAGAVASVFIWLLALSIQRKTRGSFRPLRVPGSIYQLSVNVVLILIGLVAIVRGQAVLGAIALVGGVGCLAYDALRARDEG